MRPSLRVWLLAALLIALTIPAATTVLLNATTTDNQSSISAEARAYFEQAPAWSDPAWQSAADSWTRDRHVHVVVYGNGMTAVYRSPGTPMPLEPGRLMLITDRAGQSGQLFIEDPAPARPGFFWLLELGSLLVALLVASSLLAGAVVSPLRRLAQAASRVPRGDLKLELLPSSVSEIDSLGLAFTQMSRELMAAQDLRVKLDEDRRLFVAAIAHDLRTPLFALRGYLDCLEGGVTSDAEQASRYLRGAIAKALALDKRISDLFAYARMEFLQQEPLNDRFDLSALIQQLVEDVGPRARHKQVVVTPKPPPSSCLVRADEHLIARAIENVLDNALRHAPAGGNVTVAWSYQDGGPRAVVAVCDDGPGLDPGTLHQIALGTDGWVRNPAGGAGIGLAIARRILVAHGGTLTAGNRPEGGAEFFAIIGA